MKWGLNMCITLLQFHFTQNFFSITCSFIYQIFLKVMEFFDSRTGSNTIYPFPILKPSEWIFRYSTPIDAGKLWRTSLHHLKLGYNSGCGESATEAREAVQTTYPRKLLLDYPTTQVFV